MENERQYVISIDPKILEFLGPSLYTNIYYVLAELIANAYDANASNVYIIGKADRIIVEDDGNGMSYEKGDINKYLDVAVETRTTNQDAYVEGSNRKRKKIGRKGIGKLAALAVSERVLVMTVKDREKSGFILSRKVSDDHKLEPLKENEIKFERRIKNGTSIVMTKPEYDLHKTVSAIKSNLLKIFPLVDSDFQIHIITPRGKATVKDFDREMIDGLGALKILGKEYYDLAKYFNPQLPNRKEAIEKLLDKKEAVVFPLELKNKNGERKKYDLKINGWIGTYRTTRDRKKDPNDFPDNFVSLLSNGKLGEYNILPLVGKNRLSEVYVVGQLHVDLFEETELPDMALSNRQGYKTDDPRYIKVAEYVRDTLLPEILNMWKTFSELKNKEKNKEKLARQKASEEELRKKIEAYKNSASQQAAKEITNKLGDSTPKGIKDIIQKEMNAFLPMVGIKKRVDSEKKRVMISHTKADKSFADIICKMLFFNGVPYEDIIYTNSDNADCRIPENVGVFEYLRDFFVDSYSNEKIFVIYVTSDPMAHSWYAVTEVGAGWITQSAHKVFNLYGYTPIKPLNTDVGWQTSERKKDNINMTSVEFDKFIIKILDICKQLGYSSRSKKDNEKELNRYISMTKRYVNKTKYTP